MTFCTFLYSYNFSEKTNHYKIRTVGGYWLYESSEEKEINVG